MSDRSRLPPGRLSVRPRHRRVLEALVREHLPDVEVWAYGSRVNGRGHDGSDLDLVLRGPGLEEIPIGRLGDFEDAIRESRIPFLVEARDWARLPTHFHHEIERQYVVLVGGDEDPRREPGTARFAGADETLAELDKNNPARGLSVCRAGSKYPPRYHTEGDDVNFLNHPFC